MGDRNITSGFDDKLLLRRVRLVDGDYGADGTYWGGGSTADSRLWCAYNGLSDPDFEPGMGTRIYVRARDRKAAMAAILKDYDVTFARKS